MTDWSLLNKVFVTQSNALEPFTDIVDGAGEGKLGRDFWTEKLLIWIKEIHTLNFPPFYSVSTGEISLFSLNLINQWEVEFMDLFAPNE